MKIVLDTNVLVSGLLNPSGSPAGVLNLVLNGKLRLLLDNRILNEYSAVLKRPKFGFKSEWIGPLIDFFVHDGVFISAEPSAAEFADDDDKAFYEVALTGAADRLVTGNTRHFPVSGIIVTPKEFIDFYLKQSS